MVGITAFGGYVPRLRLARKAIVAAHVWADPGLKGKARGERSMCNWDEDAVTMGVEAARNCLASTSVSPEAILFASTSAPFADRQNAGIISTALSLGEDIASVDVGASQRAGVTALIQGMAAVQSGIYQSALVVAADKRRTKAASPGELAFGDGAAAVTIGNGEVLLEFVAAHSATVDFVDHFRGSDAEHDYAWEERWIRDEGYMKIVPRALEAVLKAAGAKPESVTHFCMPCTLSRVVPAIAKRAGIAENAVRDTLGTVCGDTGAAHPLVLLVHALQDAKPGERILVASFGQGCDALLFEVTDAITQLPARSGVKGALARRKEEANYAKFLAFNDHVVLERGMRSETDKATPLSTLYRNRDMVTGLVGGKCRACGTMQFPSGRYCVNPKCNALDSQEPRPFSDVPASVMSYTADSLTYSPNPPHYYGMVQFEGGGRMMADFTDVDAVEVGMPMRMMFRIKETDPARGFVRYFWKAAPA